MKTDLFPLLAALTAQKFSGGIFLMAALVVVGLTTYLILTSRTREEKYAAKKRVYGLRARYFIGLSVILLVALVISLRLLPYERYQAKPDETVTVVAMQWTWKMAAGSSDQTPLEFTGSNEISLPAGKNIRFVVASADVNHNFAIYNSQGVLVAQTQAMPGYRNELAYRFPEKGDYMVICLEYCGGPHTIMTGKIHAL